jgi:hypothetical protein
MGADCKLVVNCCLPGALVSLVEVTQIVELAKTMSIYLHLQTL